MLYKRPVFDINEANIGMNARLIFIKTDLLCTANALPHGSIKKEPCSEWITEKPFLTPHKPYAVKV